MWSGPRNVSTALMRSWGNRPDTIVRDEPFYAYYLKTTGLPHPMADAVIRSQPNDWRRVVDQLLAPLADGKTVFYQKHMAHHLLPSIGLDWIPELDHCFLIRQPREMLPSLDEKYARPQLEDTGLPQQLRIFERIRERTGQLCPVIDSKDLLQDPRGMLAALCKRLDLPFYESMLQWPPGRRETDGVWASHWYHNVETTTGFIPYRPKGSPMPTHLEPLLAACQPFYDQLAAHRIHPQIHS